MIANYFIIDDITLYSLENNFNKGFFEKIDYIEENEDIFPICDIDEIWEELFNLIILDENLNRDDLKKYLFLEIVKLIVITTYHL